MTILVMIAMIYGKVSFFSGFWWVVSDPEITSTQRDSHILHNTLDWTAVAVERRKPWARMACCVSYIHLSTNVFAPHLFFEPWHWRLIRTYSLSLNAAWAVTLVASRTCRLSLPNEIWCTGSCTMTILILSNPGFSIPNHFRTAHGYFQNHISFIMDTSMTTSYRACI